MDLQQIEKLVQIIENSSMLEFSIQEGVNYNRSTALRNMMYYFLQMLRYLHL